MTTTIAMTQDLRNRIADRAHECHMSQAEFVDEVLDAPERLWFWSEVSAGYHRLRQDPGEWSAYVDERESWVKARL